MIQTSGSEMLKAATHVAGDATKTAEDAVEGKNRQGETNTFVRTRSHTHTHTSVLQFKTSTQHFPLCHGLVVCL